MQINIIIVKGVKKLLAENNPQNLNAKIEESIAEKNEKYFKAFIATRGGLGFLQLSLVGFMITLICLPITWHVALIGYGIEPLKSKLNILLIWIAVFMLITFLSITFLRHLLSKFQGFLSRWAVIQSVLLTFVLMLIFYILTQYDQPNEIWYGSNFSLIIILVFSLAYLSGLIYNVYWLKKQLGLGFSPTRRAANYLAKASVYSPSSLVFIFSLSILGGFLSGNVVKVFGLVGGLLFAAVFSRYTIELAYAAYLLNKNQDYWLEFEAQVKTPWLELLKGRLRKISTYVSLGLLLIVAISQIEARYTVPKVWQSIFSYLIVVILIGFVGAFSWWLVKKIKN